MSPDYRIRCDVEGGGSVHYDQGAPTTVQDAPGGAWLMAELRQGGAGRIVVYDMRFFGRNVDLDTLPGGLEVLCEARSSWMFACATTAASTPSPGRFADRMIDARTVRLTGPGATAVWAAYWEMKLVCRLEASQASAQK